MAAGSPGAVLGRPWGSRYSALPCSYRASTPAAASWRRIPFRWVAGSLEMGPASLGWAPRLRALSLVLNVTAMASVNCSPCGVRETRIPAEAAVETHQQVRRWKKGILAVVSASWTAVDGCAASEARNFIIVQRVYPGYRRFASADGFVCVGCKWFQFVRVGRGNGFVSYSLAPAIFWRDNRGPWCAGEARSALV